MWYDPLFSGSAVYFGVPAVAGTAFFLLRTVLGFAGALSHDLAPGHDHPDDHTLDAHTDGPFTAAEFFSVQSLAAFTGAFGWAGLIARESLGVAAGVAAGGLVGVAASAGVIAVFRQLRRLEAHGNVSLEDMLGLEGAVYVGIPERGRGMGQVRLEVKGTDRIVNAASRDVAVPTGGRVLVVALGPDNSVVVQAVPGQDPAIPARAGGVE